MAENTEENKEKTFIYEGREVVLTGRTALKKMRRTDKLLVEVRPLGIGKDSKTFNKWVDPKELYQVAINEPTQENNNTNKE